MEHELRSPKVAAVLCVTRMQSSRRIWPVAIKLDTGCTSKRSMARFSGRAPYLKSVPSLSENSRAPSVTFI